MRIAIYTSDLTRQNQHLMPWRTVLEIGSAACAAGHRVQVLCGRRDPGPCRWVYGDCPVLEIAKPYSGPTIENLRQVIRREKSDVLFWPVAWYSARRQGAIPASSIPVVWYVPGACYSLRQAVRALPGLGVRTALPFVWQAVYPKRRLVHRLRRPAARLMITASRFTREAVRRAGWPADEVFAIPPGRPARQMPVNGEAPVVFNSLRSRLAGRPFYLFLGPPTEVRGTSQLLRAFDQLARWRPDVCLVCLFRSDPEIDTARVRKKVAEAAHAGRIFCVWQSVGRTDLEAFLDACHAVVLPFLLVAAEIPLAVLEAAGRGKPVITTGPGGTADFVREFGLAVPAGCRGALAQAMRHLLDDQDLYGQKCSAAMRVYAAHPTWEEVTRRWLSVAEKAVHWADQHPVSPDPRPPRTDRLARNRCNRGGGQGGGCLGQWRSTS